MPLVSIGYASDLDFDALDSLNKWDAYDEFNLEHTKFCEKCAKDEYCEEKEFFELPEESEEIYTDGKFEEGNNNDINIVDSTIEILVRYPYFQILKSPKIELHGFASPCYPNQCDLDSDGDIECFGLPDEYKRGDY